MQATGRRAVRCHISPVGLHSGDEIQLITSVVLAKDLHIRVPNEDELPTVASGIRALRVVRSPQHCAEGGWMVEFVQVDRTSTVSICHQRGVASSAAEEGIGRDLKEELLSGDQHTTINKSSLTLLAYGR